ncbi:LysR family substrate-binding domain-containing protein [Nonomuraea dietziae]
MEVCREAGFEPRVGQHAVEWQTVSALVEAGLGVSLAPASIRRIRLSGVVHRRIDPDTARTAVAMCWREGEGNPLVTRFLEAARGEARR